MTKITSDLSPKQIARAYFVAAFFLFVYVFIRAVKVDFTHDESLSWQILNGDPIQLITANNHLLNTFLMGFFSKLFGYSEIVLRLPNVLAFGLYLYFIYKIYKHFSGYSLALLLAFPVLLLNPFVLDFFSLARGYGLAMAFFTGSVYYSMRFFLQENRKKYLVLACIMSVLSIYSNFSFLTAIFSIHLAGLLLLPFKRDRIKITLFLYILEVLALIPAALNIVRLKETNALYFGGDTGVISDTLRTVTISSFENSGNFVSPVMWISAFMLLVFFAVKKESSLFLKLLIPIMLLLPVACFYLLDMPFALNRAGIYWAVLIGIVVLVSIDRPNSSGYRKILTYINLTATSVIVVLFIINFSKSMNISYATIWKFDSGNEVMLKDLEMANPEKKPISLGITWLMEPSLNYYIKTRELNWLKPVTRDSVYNTYDFYYVQKTELSRVGASCKKKLDYYSTPETWLIKNCDPVKIEK